MSVSRLLVLFSLFLFGCSGSVIKPSPKPIVRGDIELTKEWGTFVGLGTSHRDLRYQMAIDDNTIYVIGRQGRLYALDKSSGDRLWIHEFKTPISAGITLRHEKLLFGTEDGKIVAFDKEAKEIAWSRSLQSELLHPPVTDGVRVIGQLNDGKLYALDINTGDVLWSIVTKNPSLTQRGSSTPLLIDNIVIAGFATGRVLIVNGLNGARIWQSEVGRPSGSNEVGRLVDIDASMYVNQSTIYINATHGDLVALSLSSQSPQITWRKDFSGGSGIVGRDRTIYATNSNGHIAAFDSQTGERYWLNDQMTNYFYNVPVLWQNHLVVADQLGYINLIDLQTGSLAGLYRNSPYAIQSDFLLEEDRLYVLDIGGFLSALKLDK